MDFQTQKKYQYLHFSKTHKENDMMKSLKSSTDSNTRMSDGNIRLNVSFKDSNAEFLNFVETFIFKWTSEHRESVRAEIDIGFLKPGFRQYSKTANEIESMKQFENLLYPQGILNLYKLQSSTISVNCALIP